MIPEIRLERLLKDCAQDPVRHRKSSVISRVESLVPVKRAGRRKGPFAPRAVAKSKRHAEGCAAPEQKESPSLRHYSSVWGRGWGKIGRWIEPSFPGSSRSAACVWEAGPGAGEEGSFPAANRHKTRPIVFRLLGGGSTVKSPQRTSGWAADVVHDYVFSVSSSRRLPETSPIAGGLKGAGSKRDSTGTRNRTFLSSSRSLEAAPR